MSNITKPVMLDDTGKSVAQALGNVATAINNLEKVQWGQVKGTLSNQTDLNNNLNSLQSQIDSFTALSDGSTTGDAELTNIRVDSAGHTYSTAGDAVRAIDAQVRDMKTGFDGVVYQSPAAMVQGEDQKLQDQIYSNNLNISKSNIQTPSNILDVSKIIQGGYINGNTGLVVYGESGTGLNSYTPFMPVSANTQYYVYPTTVFCNVVYFDSAKQRVSNEIVSNATFTTPANASFVRMSFKYDTVAAFTSVSKVQTLNRYMTILKDTFIKKPVIDTNCMKVGTKMAGDPYVIVGSDTRCYTDLIWLEKTYIEKIVANKVAVYMFTADLVFDTSYNFSYFSDHNEVYVNDGRYCQFVFAYDDDSTVTSSDFPDLSATVKFVSLEEKATDFQNKLQSLNPIVANWRNGSVGNINNANAVAFERIQSNTHATSITVLIDNVLTSGHKYRYQLTTYDIDDGITATSGSHRIRYDITYVSESNFHTFNLRDGSIGFAIALYELDENDENVPLRINTFDTSKVYFLREYDETIEASDFVISSGFSKLPITLNYLGALSGRQSFCMYDGHYWSTDGEKLYEQDSSFNVVSTTDLLLGHANALQLGSDGKAYASGWNDDKVYVVDLATKTIVETITLPVNGYTTCAVDDVNGLMYIFHRTTTSGTPTNYNFIVYDYINDNIISTKKTTRPYAAMQSCDFIDGKIFVLYGLGTDVAPNGYIVFNTVGDIIGEYIINSFSTNEPEGVFVDRTTYDVYISYVDFKLYKITQNATP